MLSQLSRLTILVLALETTGCTEHGTVNTLQSKPVFNAAHLPTVEFALPDMMCEEGCAEAVEDILARQSGVEEVRVDFDAKSATVAVDDKSFDSQQTLAALVDKGFDNSTLVSEDTAASNSSDAIPAAESGASPAN